MSENIGQIGGAGAFANTDKIFIAQGSNVLKQGTLAQLATWINTLGPSFAGAVSTNASFQSTGNLNAVWPAYNPVPTCFTIGDNLVAGNAEVDYINQSSLLGGHSFYQMTGIGAGTLLLRLTGAGIVQVPLKLALLRDSMTLVNGLNSNIAVAKSYNRISGPSAGFSVGGLTGGNDGDHVILHNTTSQQMTIVNEDASSTAANRITTLTGGNVVLRAGTSCAEFIYDASASRWILRNSN